MDRREPLDSDDEWFEREWRRDDSKQPAVRRPARDEARDEREERQRRRARRERRERGDF